jgi:hypothetical protein
MMPLPAVSSVAATVATASGDVRVPRRAQRLPRVPQHDRLHEQKQPVLRVGQIADARQQKVQIALLLSLHDRRRVAAGGREIRAGGRTRDLNNPFGPATYRADLAVDAGAGALGGTAVTE